MKVRIYILLTKETNMAILKTIFWNNLMFLSLYGSNGFDFYDLA